MDNWAVTVLVGTALGFLTGLGVGGGSLLMVWLTAVLGMDAMTARSINLLFFLPTAVGALLCHAKNGYLDKPTLKSAIPAAVLAATAGAWLATAIDVELLRRPFGIYLLFSGLSLIWPKKKP